MRKEATMICPNCKIDKGFLHPFQKLTINADDSINIHCPNCNYIWSVFLLTPAMIEAVKITIIRIRKQKRFNTCKPLETAFADVIGEPK